MPEFKIFYRRASDYKIIPATGASGGISPQGEIIFDFFVEKLETDAVVIEQLEPGKIKELSREGDKIIRELQVGIVIRPDIAHSIGKFLINTANKAGYMEEMEGRKGNA